MGIIDRIKQFADFKGISISKFCKITAIANGSFTKVKSVGSENLLKIFYAFPDINLEWLITGFGPMLKTPTPTTVNSFAIDFIERTKEFAKYKDISHIKLCHDIGLTSETFTNTKSRDCETISKIHNTFPDINLEWLISGHGPMLKTVTPTTDNSFAMELIEKKDAEIKILERKLWEQEKELAELKKRYTTPSTSISVPISESSPKIIQK